jgi:hypothetical protein
MAGREMKGGVLSKEEKELVKGLLKRKCRNQDIQYLVNIGRRTTINSARITEVKRSKIAPADDAALGRRCASTTYAMKPLALPSHADRSWADLEGNVSDFTNYSTLDNSGFPSRKFSTFDCTSSACANRVSYVAPPW